MSQNIFTAHTTATSIQRVKKKMRRNAIFTTFYSFQNCAKPRDHVTIFGNESTSTCQLDWTLYFRYFHPSLGTCAAQDIYVLFCAGDNCIFCFRNQSVICSGSSIETNWNMSKAICFIFILNSNWFITQFIYVQRRSLMKMLCEKNVASCFYLNSFLSNTLPH